MSRRGRRIYAEANAYSKANAYTKANAYAKANAFAKTRAEMNSNSKKTHTLLILPQQDWYGHNTPQGGCGGTLGFFTGATLGEPSR